MSDDIEETGPVDYLVVEFPSSRMTGEAFTYLLDLVDRGSIRILDVMFVRKDLDGSVAVLDWADLKGTTGLDLSIFQGASSGLLGQDDIDEAGKALQSGKAAGILVYENLWAVPFVRALRRSGAQLVASGRIPMEALLASLDSTEADESDEPPTAV
jgi:hypothetical protein